MGRKPLPDNVKKMAGTFQKCRERKAPTAEPITAVDRVIRHPAARILNTTRQIQILRDKAEWLVKLGILEDVDIDALVDYTVIRSLYEDALNSAESYALVIPIAGKDGQPAGFNENPYIRLALKYQKELSRIGSEFGFTPVARLKLPPPEQKLTGLDLLRESLKQK